MTNDITISRELAGQWANDLALHGVGDIETAKQLDLLLAAPVVERQEPVPITEGMSRLMEAYRLGEFRLEGGSPTVEAMSCASYDNNPIALQAYDFDSYAAGYQAAMYEEAKSLLGLIASPPAPVAVVLPERLSIERKVNNVNFNHGWNACLAKFKELNS